MNLRSAGLLLAGVALVVGGRALVGSPRGGTAAREIPTISQDAFKKLYAAHDVVVIDVRDEVSYRAGHIAGAVNVPARLVEGRATAIGADANGKTIVTYCSCPNEHASAQAAVLLTERGVKKVYALVGGYPAWVKAGGAIEK